MISKEIFQFFQSKDFWYYSGKSNSKGYWDIQFSTGINGRGWAVEIAYENNIYSITGWTPNRSYNLAHDEEQLLTNLKYILGE